MKIELESKKELIEIIREHNPLKCEVVGDILPVEPYFIDEFLGYIGDYASYVVFRLEIGSLTYSYKEYQEKIASSAKYNQLNQIKGWEDVEKSIRDNAERYRAFEYNILRNSFKLSQELKVIFPKLEVICKTNCGAVIDDKWEDEFRDIHKN